MTEAEARDHFVSVITRAFPSADVVIKQGAVPTATSFCFSWVIPDQKRRGREIAVFLYADPMNRFIGATAADRDRMSEQFERIIRTSIADGGYDSQSKSVESFPVHIYDFD